MGWKDLDSACRELLIGLYAESSLTVDDLPYTPEFERMHAEFVARTSVRLTLHDFWRALSSARKVGALTRKER